MLSQHDAQSYGAIQVRRTVPQSTSQRRKARKKKAKKRAQANKSIERRIAWGRQDDTFDALAPTHMFDGIFPTDLLTIIFSMLLVPVKCICGILHYQKCVCGGRKVYKTLKKN